MTASGTAPGADQLAETFNRTVEEGVQRLTRATPSLLATGLVGGADVSVGLFALLVVKTETGDTLLASLAFGLGFVALTLASSELFTENFLVPIAAVAAKKATTAQVGRLWAGTASMNLIGGWLVMGLIITGFPRLGPTAVEVARHYPAIGIGWRSMAGALMGGAVITLMTWMEHSTESVTGKLAAAVGAAFLLAAAPLNHVIVVSLEMFAALQHGAPFGYVDWVSVAAWYTLGNVLGGVVMVAGLRLVQIGPERLEAVRSEGRRGRSRRSSK
ncbi:MAG: formate/nitrite transporter family protein [Actinobacteria bacterium]|nr:formate/nitrite transporter family protein [Actinomycetota bacterium]